MIGQFYTRLLTEVKQRMDAGEPMLECFAARLWDQKTAMELDVESMAYSTCLKKINIQVLSFFFPFSCRIGVRSWHRYYKWNDPFLPYGYD